MVITSDQAFAEKMVLLRNHGAYPKYYHSMVGGNFRLDPIQANQYVIRVQQRDALRSWLQDRGVTTEIYYPLGLHRQQCLQTIMTSPEMPHTEEAALATLALPIYPGLTEEMQHYVVKTIRDFYD
jgi:dTDP-4-amino-4,6-dideoxygalactose transaminase